MNTRVVYSAIGELILRRKNTKEGGRMYRAYTMADKGVELSKVYKRPSDNKVEAYENCTEMCKTMEGYGWTVIHGNCHTFTYAFKVSLDKLALGNWGKEGIVYITKNNIYLLV